MATCPSQVVLDGKFGTSGPLAGPNYTITDGMGSNPGRGNNLFHSFAQFNLVAGDVATFTGPANIQNILSRVTDGKPSSINGTIRSGIVGANFFFINPSGVIFGPNAVVDVSGSFAASTASYLKLADGARFVAALDADDSGLSTAPVSAFGFLGETPGSITVQQSTLRVPNLKTITLAGGDVVVDRGSVLSPGGQINVVSVQSAGEVPMDPQTLSIAKFNGAFPQQGQISLLNSAQLDANGTGGGRVVIRGGRLLVDNSKIQANTTGATAGQGIDIAVVNDLNLIKGGQINSLSTSGRGAGGNINLNAQSIRLDGEGLMDENFNPTTQISTAIGTPNVGSGTAKGGDIVIQTGSLELVNGAWITSPTYCAGNGGRIEIMASSVRLDARLTSIAEISANTWRTSGGGSAGDIVIRTDTLDLFNGATLLAATFGTGRAGLIDINAQTVNLLSGAIMTAGTFGAGSGGNIQITCATLRIDGRDPLTSGPDFLTGIQAVTTSRNSPAPGGSIHVTADSVELDHKGSIFTTSSGLGRGGDIVVTTGRLTLANASTILAAGKAAGPAGDISLHADQNIMLSGASAVSTSALNGSGGDIEVTAQNLTLADDSTILAEGLAAGPAGGISLRADQNILLTGASAVSTSALNGSGGDIEVTAQNLTLADRSTILAEGLAAGPAGGISLRADQNILLTGASAVSTSALNGSGGDIEVIAQNLTLANGSTFLAEGLAAGPAGNISLRAAANFVMTDHSAVSTSALNGSGGDIEATAQNLTLASGSTIRAEGLAIGPAGNISLHANQNMVLTGASAVSTSALDGSGGDIEVIAQNLTLANGSTILAEGLAAGPAGNISLRAAVNFAMTDHSAVSTSALASSGGDISVGAGDEIQLTDSKITAQAGPGGGGNITLLAPSLIYLLSSEVNAEAKGDGGNVTIDPTFFVMNNSALISRSSSANGGNVTILSDYFFQSDSLIDSSAPFGLPGTVSVSAPDLDLSGSLVGLPSNLLDVEAQLRPDCRVRLAANLSSFIVLGRGGLPIAPGGFVPSGTIPPLDEAR